MLNAGKVVVKNPVMYPIVQFVFALLSKLTAALGAVGGCSLWLQPAG